jgi:uncharacterized protein (DUF305 family)
MENHMKHTSEGMHHYRKLFVMTALSFIAMYILMYAMVDRFDNVIPNINQIYMAGLMAMPMVIIELLVMGAMYKDKKRNLLIIGCSVVALIVFFSLIRTQAAVGDKQFLKSMIPHHAAAILMVNEADLTDPEIKELANKIITSQQAEIQQMKAKIKELEDKQP